MQHLAGTCAVFLIRGYVHPGTGHLSFGKLERPIRSMRERYVRQGDLRGQVTRFLTAVVLFALWLLMSGIYKPLIIAFGLGSVLLVTYVVARMDKVDGDPVRMPLKPLTYSGYLLWLLVEIAKANWVVTRIILSPGLRLRQHLFRIPVTQKSDLGQVIFANSITLTPGTITVETETGAFLVHALNYSDADPGALADMDRRITAAERAGAA
jgi:multicomponent Na+:H+ antiporter subunit E